MLSIPAEHSVCSRIKGWLRGLLSFSGLTIIPSGLMSRAVSVFRKVRIWFIRSPQQVVFPMMESTMRGNLALAMLTRAVLVVYSSKTCYIYSCKDPQRLFDRVGSKSKVVPLGVTWVVFRILTLGAPFYWARKSK